MMRKEPSAGGEASNCRENFTRRVAAASSGGTAQAEAPRKEAEAPRKK
jgi:hypothetical protein